MATDDTYPQIYSLEDLAVDLREGSIYSTYFSAFIGRGRWNSAIATYTLEAAFLAVGLWMYLRSTMASGATGRYGMSVFVVLLLVVNAANVFGPLVDDSKVTLAISSLSMYFLFAGAAHWLDGKRT